VKVRATVAAADRPLDLSRLQRVAAAAEFLVPRFLGEANTVRIDVIHIVPGYPPRHLEDVWQG
jgi:putative endonuclease